MNQYQRKLCWALLSSLLLVGSTQAGIKRVVFQGSQRIADLSKDVPRGAFYQGPDTPNNLSPGCPTCKRANRRHPIGERAFRIKSSRFFIPIPTRPSRFR